jgi:hypothetical protein
MKLCDAGVTGARWRYEVCCFPSWVKTERQGRKRGGRVVPTEVG